MENYYSFCGKLLYIHVRSEKNTLLDILQVKNVTVP